MPKSAKMFSRLAEARGEPVDETRNGGLQPGEQFNLLQLFIKYTPAAVAMFDREMRYIAVSDRYKEDYRIGDQDIIGRSHYDVFPEIPARWKDIHKRCLAGAVEKTEEDPFPRSDGRLDWIKWEIRPWQENQGEVGGIILFSEVITRWKEREEEILARAQELNHLNTLGLQLSQSHTLSQVLDVMQANLLDSFKPDGVFLLLKKTEGYQLVSDSPESNAGIRNAITATENQDFIARIALENGEPLYLKKSLSVDQAARAFLENTNWAACALLPMAVGGQLLGVLGLLSLRERDFKQQSESIEASTRQIVSNIHRVQLDEEMKQHAAELELRVNQRTAELEALNQELRSFSYSVSHDLRAPLRAINGFASIIARRYQSNLNDEGQHYLGNIVLASERMGRLIDDLLTYSHLGQSGIRHEPVSLTTLLAGICVDLQEPIRDMPGTISIDPNLPVIYGDKTLLNVIFNNLLENAITYRKKDVPFDIIITAVCQENDHVIEVRDNGIGIPHDYHERIFHVFERLHRQEEYPGTGIGLANVKKSIELLGGSVWVQSEVGIGSSFFLKFPRPVEKA